MAAGRCESRWRDEQDRLVLRGIADEMSKAAGCCGVQQAKRARLPGIGNRGRKNGNGNGTTEEEKLAFDPSLLEKLEALEKKEGKSAL